jgi:hypothetical protein
MGEALQDDYYERRKDADAEQFYDAYDLRKHPLCCKQGKKCKMTPLLRRDLDKNVIVWETQRRKMKMPPFLHGNFSHTKKDSFIRGLKECLREAPPFNDSHMAFWTWMESKATDAQLDAMYCDIKEQYVNANGSTVAFNPILSFCTASHNNVSLLGSIGQAKSAMFYLIPHQGKNKFPIQQSLSIIDSAIKHCAKFESQSTKGDKGTVGRTVKQLLARTLNQMHLRMELSDYQVTAALLDLPSMIQSDQFVFGKPASVRAFRVALERHEREMGARAGSQHNTLDP